jgi:hypothetical protein
VRPPPDCRAPKSTFGTPTGELALTKTA